MIRLFVGLSLPEPDRHALGQLQCGLKNARWVAANNLHVTLRFIGAVDERQAEDYALALGSVLAHPFDLMIKGVGTFGHPPHNLWAGVADQPAGALAHLQANVESALVRAGLPPEGQKFSPHVTLARLKKSMHPGSLADFLAAHETLQQPSFKVNGFTLFESRLSTVKHHGAHYSAFAEYDF